GPVADAPARPDQGLLHAVRQLLRRDPQRQDLGPDRSPPYGPARGAQRGRGPAAGSPRRQGGDGRRHRPSPVHPDLRPAVEGIVSRLPTSVLYVCSMNRVRSPMAAALTRKLYGEAVAVESSGLRASDEVDPMAGA